jgi:hypothetical protein
MLTRWDKEMGTCFVEEMAGRSTSCDGGRDGRVAFDAREKSRGGALTQRRRADDRKKER